MAGKITQAAEVDLNVKGSQSIKSIKQELKEAKEQAILLSRQFGEFSPQALEAQKKFAALKDEMEDFGHRVNALNPDKFSRIGTAAQGLAHGFSAAQGAAALFGSESENVQRSLQKVQGAMALSQGLQGLGDAKQGLLSLGASIKGPVVKAFSSLRSALISTGIGALVVALGLLIANFDSVKKAVTGMIDKVPGLSSVVKALGEAWDWVTEKITAFTDALGLTDSKVDAQIKTLEKSTAAAKREAEIQEALGKDTYEQRKKILQDELKIMELNKDEQEKILDKKHEIRLLDAKREKETADKVSQEAEKQREKEKAAAEKAAQEWRQRAEAGKTTQKAISQELELIRLDSRQRELRELEIWRDQQAAVLRAAGQNLSKLTQLYREKETKMRAQWAEEDKKAAEKQSKELLEIEQKRIEDQMALLAKEYQDTQQNSTAFFTQEKTNLTNQLLDKSITRDQYDQKVSELQLKSLERQLLDAKDYGQSTVDLENQLSEIKLQNSEKNTAKQVALDQKERESKMLLLNSTLSAIQELGMLMTSEQGKRDKIGRAFALSQIAIDTAQAISSLVKNSEQNPSNSVTFGLAGAAQFAAGIARILVNIKKASELLKAPAPSGLGGGVSGAGGAGASRQVDQFRQIGQDIRISKLSGGDQGGTGGPRQQPIPVVEFADIRKVGRRVSVLEGASQL